MVWIESCPEKSIVFPFNEPIVKLIHVAHTSLLVLLTASSVYLINQHTLLPIASHTRTSESIESHGKNINVKTKHVSVNTVQLQKASTVNLFVHSDKDYIVIYSILINHSTSFYEIHSTKTDSTLQTGLPLSYTAKKFSLAGFFKSATKTIIQGGEKASVNLENIEHLNNSTHEDEQGGFIVTSAKISVFKILKIKIGLERYWFKQNSHNLIIYNGHERRPDNEKGESGEEYDDSHFQIINIQTFKNSVLSLYESEWYKNKSRVVYINYNIFKNYFIFMNEEKELWYLHFETHEGADIKAMGTKLKTSLTATHIQLYFNSHYDLILALTEDDLSIYKIDISKSSLEQLSKIKKIGLNTTSIGWSSCGEFFTVLDTNTGHWSLHTKFGNSTFNSFELLNELEERDDQNREFLKCSRIIISPNSSSLHLVSLDHAKMFTVNLLKKAQNTKSFFRDSNYIIAMDTNKSFVKFPVPPKFKSIINNIEGFNGSKTKSLKSFTGQLNISRNKFNQFSITYGDEIAISTPLAASIFGNYLKENISGDSSAVSGEINHVLWFNFKNYYTDTLNIVNHYWFNGYLVLINRKFNDEYTDVGDEDLSSDGMGHLVDEIIVLNTPSSRYGNGGENFVFDSDLILWKYDFKTTFVNVDLIEVSSSLSNLLFLTKDLRLVIIELNDKKLILDESLDASDHKSYNIFIGVNKTIHLSTISSKLNLKNVIQSTMIQKKHFLFLLNTGELYLLKNQSAEGSITNPVDAMKPSNMYDLVLVNRTIESFKTQSIQYNDEAIEYLLVFGGHKLLLYELKRLILDSFDKSSTVNDGIDEPEELTKDLNPVSIEIENWQPIELYTNDGIDALLQLVAIENQVLDRSTIGGLIIRPKLSHKFVLNNFIENELRQHHFDLQNISSKYSNFKGYSYCLELLLFKYLTDNHEVGGSLLKPLISLIDLNTDAERIFINCLRKIEIGYWELFFTVLNTSPVDFMNRLIEKGDVELCYNFLIVYLNFKKEETPKSTGKRKKNRNKQKNAEYLLDSKDKKVILQIVDMLDEAKKWDWCFELCRFIKLLEPSGALLKEIKSQLAR